MEENLAVNHPGDITQEPMTQGGVRGVWDSRKPFDRGEGLVKELFPAELRHRKQGHELLTLTGDYLCWDIPEHLAANPAKHTLSFLGPVFQELPVNWLSHLVVTQEILAHGAAFFRRVTLHIDN
jgi:hypothetical protein